MSYKVSLYLDCELDQLPKHYINRTQAIAALRKLAYAKLEAFGKLDTDAAHKLMATIEACDDILPPQAERYLQISNTGYSLILRNTASAPQ